MSINWIIIAVAPAWALGWILHTISRPQRLGWWTLALLFCLGWVSAFIALILNHSLEKYTDLWQYSTVDLYRNLFWLFGAGLNEEFAKLLMVLLVVYPRKKATPIECAIAAGIVALGLAAAENILYSEQFGRGVLLSRSFLTIPAHAFFSIPMGWCAGKGANASSLLRTVLWLLVGLAFSAAVHGLYNITISSPQPGYHIISYSGLLILGMLSAWLLYTGRSESKQDDHRPRD